MATTTTQPIKLYVDLISQPARAVIAFCIFNKIPYELIEVRVFKGQQKTPEFAKVNPLQKIPTMVEGDFMLSESQTIMRYLCNSRDVAQNWYPRDDAKKRALIDVYLNFHHSDTRRCTHLIVATNMPDSEFVKTHHISLEAEKKFIHHMLRTIESFFLKDKKFIAGDEISIADLSAYSEIVQLRLMNFDYSPYPVLQKWLDRCSEFQAIKDLNKLFTGPLKKLDPKPKL